ncbi:hypothetical protein [Leifsonia shinshuensis]|uniref:hypothetical protein n=1 Tax=Leifsonia shinshuensis TaxID=150026 RepID=UPI002857695E|nr:hypothetical protein [Leifsonia shinshuensis]MDR6969755.1 hypothetical protein [Leifsonia shinshuensis]
MWASAGVIVVGLIGLAVIAALHAGLWPALVSVALMLTAFVLLGVSGRANLRTGGRRAGAPADGKPSAVNKWVPYVVSAGFLISGLVYLVIEIVGGSGRGVLTALLIIVLGVGGYFVLRKVSDDRGR